MDNLYINVIKIVVKLGVDVYLMILCKLDHLLVYWVIYLNVLDLLFSGVKIYMYENGFIYFKMCLIDDEMVLVGIVNMDFRSFELNFEVNVFVYDEKFVKDLRVVYEYDIIKLK